MTLDRITMTDRPRPERVAPIGLAACALALLGSPIAGACAGLADAGAPAASSLAQVDGSTESPADGVDVTPAIEALRSGDFELARSLVDGLFVQSSRAEAADRLAAGDPFAAIDLIDKALEVSTLDRDSRGDLLMLRGRCAFNAAGSDVRFAARYEEALENFLGAARSGAGVSAALRASRSARMLGENAQALDLARSAGGWIDAVEGRGKGLDLDQPYLRTWAEASFGAYLAATPAEGDDAAQAEKVALFAETQGTLERLIAQSPTETWAYGQLANLHLWGGNGAAALTTLETGLRVRPDDEATHTALVRLLGDQAEAEARAAGMDDSGALDARFDAIIGRYEAFRETHPENALGYWYGGFEQFYRAVTDFERADVPEAFDAAGFLDAEDLFRGCREREPGFEPSCVDYEILCRLGAGWSLYRRGEDARAIETFFSVEELRDAATAAATGRTAGLDMVLTGGGGVQRLPSALAGLDFVTRRLLTDPTDTQALTEAAALGDRMFAARPEHPALSNNAGFLNRDAAVLWELDATRRLQGPITEAERAAAMESRRMGQTLMERSWAAYQVAARLQPEDVRVVNDTGLIMAYYLRTDADAAEGYFLRSVELGGPQLENPDLTDEARDALNEAWGDAHQNMGILEMTIRRDPSKAKDWFVRSLEIGPSSRNWLRTDVLPLLDAWISSGERPSLMDAIEARTVWSHNP